MLHRSRTKSRFYSQLFLLSCFSGHCSVLVLSLQSAGSNLNLWNCRPFLRDTDQKSSLWSARANLRRVLFMSTDRRNTFTIRFSRTGAMSRSNQFKEYSCTGLEISDHCETLKEYIIRLVDYSSATRRGYKARLRYLCDDDVNNMVDHGRKTRRITARISRKGNR